MERLIICTDIPHLLAEEFLKTVAINKTVQGMYDVK